MLLIGTALGGALAAVSACSRSGQAASISCDNAGARPMRVGPGIPVEFAHGRRHGINLRERPKFGGIDLATK